MMEDKYICKICSRGFVLEDYLKQHMQTHMLPKLKVDGSVKELEWKIVEPNEDGRFSCLDCNGTYSCVRAAKEHHKNVHMKAKKFEYELEKLQYGWIACLRCFKTFLSIQNAKCHFKDEHVGKNKEGTK